MPLSGDQIEALERLSALRSSGALSEEEFAELKASIMEAEEVVRSDDSGESPATSSSTRALFPPPGRLFIQETSPPPGRLFIQETEGVITVNRPLEDVRSAVLEAILQCGLHPEFDSYSNAIRTVGGYWRFNDTGVLINLFEQGPSTVISCEGYRISGMLQSTRRVTETVSKSIRDTLVSKG
jgi:hypothetical protein